MPSPLIRTENRDRVMAMKKSKLPRRNSSTPKVSKTSGIELLQTVPGHGEWVSRLKFSPDGRWLAIPYQGGLLEIWDVERAKLYKQIDLRVYHIFSVAWSPEGAEIATTQNDRFVRFWDRDTGKLIRETPVYSIEESEARREAYTSKVRFIERTAHIQRNRPSSSWRHQGALNLPPALPVPEYSQNQWDEIRAAAWSPTGRLFATGHDGGVQVWDVSSWNLKIAFREQLQVISVAWSPNEQRLAASSYRDRVCVFDVVNNSLLYRVPGSHAALAWSPDGTMLVSAFENDIYVWNSASGKLLRVLEGHTVTPRAVSFSNDGALLASSANTYRVKGKRIGDDRTLLWRTDAWTCCGYIKRKMAWYVYTGLDWSPTAPLLAAGSEADTAVQVWRLDYRKLYKARPITQTVFYKNAKVALLGDTGVGKSGLHLVLTGKPFVATESTHARKIMPLKQRKVSLGPGIQEVRDILLWDFAGQPGYRLIHQLHLEDVNVALLVFDSRNELHPFSGIIHWNKALLQCSGPTASAGAIPRILVAARIDVGVLGVSKARIESLLTQLGISSYVETSAKLGVGIDKLREEIAEAIDWDSLPRITSNALFQNIKLFLNNERKGGRVLASLEELRKKFVRDQRLSRSDSPTFRQQFSACLGRLQTLGLLRQFSFGNLTLLQPEILDSYASSIVFAAKSEPDGMGSILEEQVRSGTFAMQRDRKMGDEGQEKLLLLATIEDLLSHEIALREPAEDGTLLVFPSQLTRENPELPDPPGKEVVFEFEGPILNIYAALVVRLAHGTLFKTKDMWKNAVVFSAKIGGACGLYLTEIDEGRAKITLFYDEMAKPDTRFQFEDYVYTHLKRRSLPNTLVRRRILKCPNTGCATSVSEEVISKRLARGYFVTCNVCDTNIALVVTDDHVPSAASVTTREIDSAATRRKLVDAGLVSASAEMELSSFRTWAGADQTTLALVFTDIVGSTSLGTEIGDEAMRDVREAHYHQARTMLKECDGYEIKTIGDSFMVAFRTAVHALNFALKLQKSTGHPRVAIRAGIHVGAVRIEAKDAFGSMVDFTARIQHCAANAEIWLSDRAHSDIETEKSKAHAQIIWRKHPHIELKGFKEPQTLWSIESVPSETGGDPPPKK